MNNKQYLERQIELTKKLEAAFNARPYNPDAFSRIAQESLQLHDQHFKSGIVKRILRAIKTRVCHVTAKTGQL